MQVLPRRLVACLVVGMAAGVSLQPLEAQEVAPADTVRQDTVRVGRTGGPSSVQQQVEEDASRRELSAVQQAEDWLDDHLGLQLGLDYNLTAQMLNESPGATSAAGGVFRFYGHWTPFSRGSPSAGSLVFKLENRSALGSGLSPQALGPTAGYAGLTAVTFSDAGWILSNFYWTQALFDNAFAFNVGIVDVTDYIDVFGLVNAWTEYNNFAFTTGGASIPAPGQGLGAVVRWNLTNNYYLTAGMADANGDPSRWFDVFESFFDTSEYFWHAEAGWIGSWDKRYSDNIHLSFWAADDRVEAGVDGGWGLAASISHSLGDRWQPFLRGGYADGGGALLARTVSAGTGYQLMDRGDLVGVGANWGRPPEEAVEGDPRDQWTFEIYYKSYQIPQLEIWPSFQFLIDPAYLPESTSLWLVSVRVRLVL